MMMKNAIVTNGITKKYKLYNSGKERILDLITPRSYGEDFYALRDINLEMEKGDVVGFIGINGSGKSTLSNIIAGIVPATFGDVSVNGPVSLIAVAAGLDGELTGRDNIELKCLMLGFSKKEIKYLEPVIIEFSELEKFIDQPVKSYSSGMRSRLGFAISISINPDILIIDEALSVGDKAFAEKSLAKMKEFKEQEKTMIFVSHSIGQMKQFCDKILWLEFGMIKEYGPVEDIIPQYEKFLSIWQKMSKDDREKYKSYSLLSDQDSLDELMKEREKQMVRREEAYQEYPVSILGHIRGGESFVYSTPTDLSRRESSKEYKNYVYYIKKQAKFNGELFYLLSKQPSAQKGVIGWMKSSDVSRHNDVAIDSDPKMFYLKGTGAGFNKPWGGRKDSVYPNLTSFKGAELKVNQTKKVGNNIWYHGILEGKEMWIHASYLSTRSL